jgi:hypothetical protein
LPLAAGIHPLCGLPWVTVRSAGDAPVSVCSPTVLTIAAIISRASVAACAAVPAGPSGVCIHCTEVVMVKELTADLSFDDMPVSENSCWPARQQRMRAPMWPMAVLPAALYALAFTVIGALPPRPAPTLAWCGECASGRGPPSWCHAREAIFPAALAWPSVVGLISFARSCMLCVCCGRLCAGSRSALRCVNSGARESVATSFAIGSSGVSVPGSGRGWDPVGEAMVAIAGGRGDARWWRRECGSPRGALARHAVANVPLGGLSLGCMPIGLLGGLWSWWFWAVGVVFFVFSHARMGRARTSSSLKIGHRFVCNGCISDREALVPRVLRWAGVVCVGGLHGGMHGDMSACVFVVFPWCVRVVNAL